MYSDAPNLFRVKFTLKLECDFAKSFIMFDDWYENVRQKLQNDHLIETFHQMEVSNTGYFTFIQIMNQFFVLNLKIET